MMGAINEIEDGTEFLGICPRCFRVRKRHTYRNMAPSELLPTVLLHWMSEGLMVRRGKMCLEETYCVCGLGKDEPVEEESDAQQQVDADIDRLENMYLEIKEIHDSAIQECNNAWIEREGADARLRNASDRADRMQGVMNNLRAAINAVAQNEDRVPQPDFVIGDK